MAEIDTGRLLGLKQGLNQKRCTTKMALKEVCGIEGLKE
jgi:hypothetical protein